jgi:hypothetical protein
MNAAKIGQDGGSSVAWLERSFRSARQCAPRWCRLLSVTFAPDDDGVWTGVAEFTPPPMPSFFIGREVRTNDDGNIEVELGPER